MKYLILLPILPILLFIYLLLQTVYLRGYYDGSKRFAISSDLNGSYHSLMYPKLEKNTYNQPKENIDSAVLTIDSTNGTTTYKINEKNGKVYDANGMPTTTIKLTPMNTKPLEIVKEKCHCWNCVMNRILLSQWNFK